MHVCYLLLHVHLPGVRTIKDRRSIVNRFLSRARDQLNISIMEADRNSVLDEARFAAVYLAPTDNDVVSVAERLESLALASGAVEVVGRDRKIIEV